MNEKRKAKQEKDYKCKKLKAKKDETFTHLKLKKQAEKDIILIIPELKTFTNIYK